MFQYYESCMENINHYPGAYLDLLLEEGGGATQFFFFNSGSKFASKIFGNIYIR
jgi:hypothetical protein